jgi:16S rRNA processing protein RimM
MPAARILLGVIGRPHGVRGLVRVTSYADPPEALTAYGPLSDEAGRCFTVRWRGDSIVELAEMVGGTERKIADRDTAARLTNTRLFVARDRLPEPDDDEYYLADLVGLTATDASGATIGCVAAVHDYGAGASLEIKREAGPLVVPFTRDSVPEVDVAGGILVVTPPAEVDALPPMPRDANIAPLPPERGERLGEEGMPVLNNAADAIPHTPTLSLAKSGGEGDGSGRQILGWHRGHPEDPAA